MVSLGQSEAAWGGLAFVSSPPGVAWKRSAYPHGVKWSLNGPERKECEEHQMTLFALALVLSAGLFHAIWNLLAKRVGKAGASFVWLYTALSALLYAPVALAAIFSFGAIRMGSVGLLFVLGTAVLHIGYFLSLQKGYAVSDLSVVYPLARGTGPLLASAAAVVLFGERPGPVAVIGILLIGGGVVALAWEPGGDDSRDTPKKNKRLGVTYGLLTGAFIASYTLWDKQAVSGLELSPILYYWAGLSVQALLLAPVALRRKGEVRAAWRAHRPEVLGVAVLSPLSYLLVLTALVFAPVSHVAPAREVGILIGTAMGGGLLGEGSAPRRLAAAGAIVAGVVALALA
jgi:drug/metabolite transporter (DMT)-like permease